MFSFPKEGILFSKKFHLHGIQKMPRDWYNSCGNPAGHVATALRIHPENIQKLQPSLVAKVAKAGRIPPRMSGIHQERFDAEFQI